MRAGKRNRRQVESGARCKQHKQSIPRFFNENIEGNRDPDFGILLEGKKRRGVMLDKIKELCTRNQISIFQLEKQCGLSNGSVYHWDKIAPSYDKVIRVAKVLGVTVEELAGGEA